MAWRNHKRQYFYLLELLTGRAPVLSNFASALEPILQRGEWAFFALRLTTRKVGLGWSRGGEASIKMQAPFCARIWSPHLRVTPSPPPFIHRSCGRPTCT
jgi:hypothetical protein